MPLVNHHRLWTLSTFLKPLKSQYFPTIYKGVDIFDLFLHLKAARSARWPSPPPPSHLGPVTLALVPSMLTLRGFYVYFRRGFSGARQRGRGPGGGDDIPGEIHTILTRLPVFPSSRPWNEPARADSPYLMTYGPRKAPWWLNCQCGNTQLIWLYQTNIIDYSPVDTITNTWRLCFSVFMTVVRYILRKHVHITMKLHVPPK